MEVNFFWNLLYRMPRKPRLTAVPVEQQDLTPVLTREVTEEQGKTDAEQMTDIINEVKEERKADIEQVLFEVPLVAPELPVVAKENAKRASRAKPQLEPILTLNVAEQEEEEPHEVPKAEPKEEPKSDDKVACSDCGKQMSAKTLKYSHGPNCSSKKPKTKTEDDREAITEAMIEHDIRTRSRAERATRREANMIKLMQTAF